MKKSGIYIQWNYYSAVKNKEILQYVTMWVNLEDIMPSEISQSQKDNTGWFHSFEVSEIVKLIEAEGRIVVVRG